MDIKIVVPKWVFDGLVKKRASFLSGNRRGFRRLSAWSSALLIHASKDMSPENRNLCFSLEETMLHIYAAQEDAYTQQDLADAEKEVLEIYEPFG